MSATKEVAHAVLASKLKILGAPTILGTRIVTPLAMAPHILHRPAANQCALGAKCQTPQPVSQGVTLVVSG